MILIFCCLLAFTSSVHIAHISNKLSNAEGLNISSQVSCQNGWKVHSACEGKTIRDLNVEENECIEGCKSNPECNCVTWMFDEVAHCRLVSGIEATDRGTDSYKGCEVTKPPCKNGWKPQSACEGRVIENHDLGEHECITQCQNHAECNCVTWMIEEEIHCRLVSGTKAINRGDDISKGCEVKESSCENGWKLQSACGGRTLVNINVDEHECIERCQKHPECNCVTWMFDDEFQHCKLNSGTKAINKGTDAYKGCEIKESSCENGWKLQSACGGRTIADFDLEIYECIELCKSHSECNCVTWMFDQNAHCRLQSGTKATDRGTDIYKGCEVKESTCENGWKPHSKCGGRTIDVLDLEQYECIYQCKENSECNCVTWMPNNNESCRLKTGAKAIATGTDTHSCEVKEATCENGWKPQSSCDGRIIADLDLQEGECIEGCKSYSECNCVTWLFDENTHCRLQSGTNAIYKSIESYKGCEVKKSTCENGWQPHSACEGRILADLDLGEHKCIERCKNSSQCNCVTWIQDKAPHCRLQSGIKATERGTESLKACEIKESICKSGWKLQSTCEGTVIADVDLGESDCIARCKGNDDCNCVTWMLNEDTHCRLVTGQSLTSEENNVYRGCLIHSD